MSAATKVRKPKVSKPPTRPRSPRPESIPLADVSITIPKPRIFSGEKEGATVTFAGDNLARALRYIALACPNLELFTEAEYLAIELAGVADICNGLSESDLHGAPVDCHGVFHALYRRLDDLAARINAGEDTYNKLASVTIARRPVAEGGASAEQDAARKIATYDAAQKIVYAVKKAGKGKVAQ